MKETLKRLKQGEQVVIVRKAKLLVLQPFELPAPIPIRPPGYFDDCYDKAATKESNKLAARSARRIVK